MLWFARIILLATFSEAASLATRAISCREFAIPVSISSGNYNISARYCAPSVTNTTRANALQFLVHGITYTKDYWSGLAAPGTKTGQDQYSWIVYAANQGYSTLSIDRLCNGNSSHPNGYTNCQPPAQTETVHAIVQLARGGKLPTVSTAFTKVVYVGHSYGSGVGNILSVQYPNDIDAYILSGFSLALNESTIALIVLPVFLPATVALPSRFGFLGADISYLTATSQSGIQQVFYYGNYDPSILQYDFSTRGTVSLGEVGSGDPGGQQTAPNYKGALFILNGNEDLVFCSKDQLSAFANVTANCANGFSSGVKQAYPAVSQFGFHNTESTGHCLNVHRTAQESFKAAHDFLASVGF